MCEYEAYMKSKFEMYLCVMGYERERERACFVTTRECLS